MKVILLGLQILPNCTFSHSWKQNLMTVPVCDGANYPGVIKHGLLENPTFIDDITRFSNEHIHLQGTGLPIAPHHGRIYLGQTVCQSPPWLAKHLCFQAQEQRIPHLTISAQLKSTLPSQISRKFLLVAGQLVYIIDTFLAKNQL